MPHQHPPHGDWRTWVILGGRGAGKTRAGAEWVRAQVEGTTPTQQGRCKCIALLGETLDQVREVMVFGISGIISSSPPDRVPQWESGRKRLVWPNGALAYAFSARDAEALRGPQFDGAWSDELCKWRNAKHAWDMLQFGLRLGHNPQQVITTTPRNIKLLHRILNDSRTVNTQAATEANRTNLAPCFIRDIRQRYKGTYLERQELDGALIKDPPDALWKRAVLEKAYVKSVPHLHRIVVAVDPPVGRLHQSDECGIIVAGVVHIGDPRTWRAYVLEDASISNASPMEWSRKAILMYEKYKADRIVAEVNQGGDMVESVIRQIDPLVSYRAVWASRGKTVRAEPIAALYEQGRVKHTGDLTQLEDQMCDMTLAGYFGKKSPDRVDALVWALHDLMIASSAHWSDPRLRIL